MNLQRSGLMSGSLLNSGVLQPDAKSCVDESSATLSSSPVAADCEASRTAGDAQLANEYAAHLMTGLRLKVPLESTLGRWLEVLKSAFSSPVLKSVLEKGEVLSLEIDPAKGQIGIKYQGTWKNESVSLVDVPGGLSLFDSLVAAAKALTPNGVLNLPAYFKDDTVALSDIQNFYGEPGHLTAQQKADRSKELALHPIFQGQGSLPDNDSRLDIARAIGDATTWHNLFCAVSEQVKKNGSDLGLEATPVVVAPHSTFWSEQPQQPVMRSLKQLLIDYGLNVPTTHDGLVNLEHALAQPPLRAPNEGDYGGLLSKDVPLGEDDQKKLIETVSAWKTRQTPLPLDAHGRAPSLFEHLQRAVSTAVRDRVAKEPEAFLQALIDTPQARALGKQLQEAINAPATETSVREVLLAALGLEADPEAGRHRTQLAGYNLRQQDNWGQSPAEIVRRFEKHLEARFDPQMANVVAFQLLAMSAPEFLVKELPASLVYGSQQWASFSAAVLRREQDTPGSSAGQKYADIMRHDDVEPITDVALEQSQFAAMQSVIDWGIANGVIDERDDDSYAPEAIERAVAALQQQADGLVEAAQALANPMPTRRELALAELRRVYGAQNERFFEDQTLLGDLAPGSRKRGTRSLLDIYMSGELEKYPWSSDREDFSTATFRSGIPKLADIQAKFDEQFTTYTDGLKKASGVLFQYQVSQLPAEDRLMLERGSVSTFDLGVPDSNRTSARTDHPMFKYVENNAILIRAELEGKAQHYVYSPSQGKIIKNANPDSEGLKFPKSLLTFTMKRSGEKEDTVQVLWQALGDRWPKKEKVDFAAFRVYPSKSLERQAPGPHLLPRADVPSKRIEELGVSVSAFYSRGLDDLKTQARGETPQERDKRRNKAIGKFLLGFIPFYDAVTSFKEGKSAQGLLYAVLDIVGFVFPAVKGGSQAVKAGPKGLGAGLSFLKGFVKTGVKAANPLSEIFDRGRGVFNVGRAGLKKLRNTQFASVDKLRHGRGRSGSLDVFRAGKKDVIAEGVYRPLGEKAEAVPVLAVQRNGKWYAYDQKTMLAYGAPLKGYTPSIGSDLGQEVRSAVVDRAIDVGFGIAFEHPQRPRHAVNLFQRLPPQTLNEQQDAVRELADQAQMGLAQVLRLKIQKADRDLAALEGAEVSESVNASQEEAGDLLERLDKMEDALGHLEEQLIDQAQEAGVFFKRYLPPSIDPLSINATRERLIAIEKRLAAVSNAIRGIQKERNQVAEGTV